VGGSSIFVPEYTTDNLNGDMPGDVSIQYIQNKKSPLIDLLVLDSCALDGLAKVQLPANVMLEDGSTQPTDGFYVYAKITGKPNNGTNCDPEVSICPSNIILYPNRVVDACNDPNNPDFGNLTQCPEDDPLVALGVLWYSTYIPDPATGDFVRFDPLTTSGKGKSIGQDITRLFIYVGFVVSPSIDTNGDGVIDLNDVPHDYTGDPAITEDDVAPWLREQAALYPSLVKEYTEADNMWMHDIADLVVTEQGLTNSGTKTLQVRFYPRSTTVFQ